MDILDLFNDGSLDPAQFQNVKVRFTQSEEELRKWTTDENLPEGRKALHLLSKGFALQKVAILRNLSQLISESELGEVLPVVFVPFTQRELPTWEEVLQIEAGNGLLTALQRGLFPTTRLSALLDVALVLLSTWSDPVHVIWLQVFAAVLDKLPTTSVLPIAGKATLHLGESSQTVSTRLVACQLLGILARRIKADFRGELLQRALQLSQDLSFEVRKHMCIELKRIIRAIGEDLHARVFLEVVKLVQDEEAEVRLEAVPLLLDVADLLPGATVQSQVLPWLCEEFFPSRDQGMRGKLAECCGEIAVKFAFYLRNEDLRRQFVDFFLSIASSSLASERLSAAFNFPAIISSIDFSTFEAHLQGSYISLCRDTNIEVQTTMAKSYHEVLHLMGDKASSLNSVFQDFFSEEAMFGVIIKHLGEIVERLKTGMNLTRLIAQLTAVLVQKRPWRVLDKVLEELCTALEYFPLPDLIETLQPALLSLLPQVSLPLKFRIAQLLARFISINYLSDFRSELCSSITSVLSNSQQYQARLTFVHFCVELLGLMSRRFFRHHFWQALMRVMRDPIVNVRLKVVQNLVFLHIVFCTDEELRHAFAGCVATLQGDADSEVARLAGEVQVREASRDHWAAVQAFEVTESERQQREDLQIQQEAREREEAKKKLVQVLTEKARMEYLQQYKDRRLGKAKPGKPLGSSHSLVLKTKVDMKPDKPRKKT